MKILLLSLGIVAAALLVLVVLRLLDARADRILARSLIADTTATPPRFEPAMLDGLPDPAARFFRFVMEDGAPLHTVARITMQGQLNLGLAEKATFQAMQARQTLAPPHGFVWQVRLGGLSKITGTDAYRPDTSWSRFRLLDLIPVGRVSDNPDHLRSAFGRMVGEGLFWTPAAFLPATRAGWDQIAWHPVDAQTAAVVVRHNGLEQRAEVTVDAGGRPLRVVFDRWSNANTDRLYRLQPFGGDLGAFEVFDGFRLPTRVVGGNHYGTPLYHPFYKAEVTHITFR